MKGELFTHEVSKTSSVFGRKQDVNVVFKGDTACTDGATVVLPSIDLTGEVSDETASVIRGYVDHEAGHVRHTDFDEVKKLGEEVRRTGNKLLKSLANGLEDIWLERRVIDEYPGARRNLIATSDAVNKEFLDGIAENDPRLRDDKFITAVALTWEGRKDYGGETCGKCLDRLDDGLRTALKGWITAIGACENTADVIALAREVERQLITGEHRDDDERRECEGENAEGEGDTSVREPDGDNPESGGDGASEQPVGEGDDRDADDGSEGSRSADDAKPPETGEGDGQEKSRLGGVGAKSESYTGEVYEDFDLSTAVNTACENDDLISDGGSYRPYSTASDKWHHRSDPLKKYVSVDGIDQSLGAKVLAKGGRAEYDAVLGEASGVVNIMRRKLERVLLASLRRDWRGGREEGRLDNRRLTSAYCGKPSVFKLQEPCKEMDTALTILVDLSGSMAKRVDLARLAIIAMVEAIDKSGVSYEVLGFNNATHMLKGVETRSVVRDGDWSRYDPLDMYIFKDFVERLHYCKGAIASIKQCVNGDNSDGEAVLNAYDRLRKRPEKRKIMIVFSDGMPATSTAFGHRHLSTHLRNVVASIERDGTDLIGVGVMSDAVEAFYSKYVVVRDLDDLSGEAMDVLAKALMGDRFVVDNSKLMNAS